MTSYGSTASSSRPSTTGLPGASRTVFIYIFLAGTSAGASCLSIFITGSSRSFDSSAAMAR